MDSMAYLADIDIPAVIGVLTGFGLVVIVPIVAMLLSHQRKMAELVRGARSDQAAQANARLDRMEHEISVMRQLLSDNIIALDDHRPRPLVSNPPPVPEHLRAD